MIEETAFTSLAKPHGLGFKDTAFRACEKDDLVRSIICMEAAVRCNVSVDRSLVFGLFCEIVFAFLCGYRSVTNFAKEFVFAEASSVRPAVESGLAYRSVAVES